MRTPEQETSLKEFEQFWYHQWAQRYRSLNGAFSDVQVIHEPRKINDNMILLARIGKDCDGEVDDSWCDATVFWIQANGKVLYKTDYDVLDCRIPIE